MKNFLPQKWIDKLDVLDIAFQPILNIHTGKLFAVEALLRNFQDIGFKSIFSLFDKVYKENLLYSFDIALREKTLIKFSKIKNYEDIKLFYNLDNRLFEMPNFTSGNTCKILKKLDIKKENLCFEISERHQVSSECNLEKILQHYQDEYFQIAIDDFGVGYSGYKLLYESKPDVIKIDRFFLQGIESNPKKQLLVRNITHLAVQLGIKVIAEGAETKAELLTSKDLGCHLVQGYLIQRPTKDVKEIIDTYTHIKDIVNNNQRKKDSNSKIENHIDKIDSLDIKTKMDSVIEYFKKNNKTTIVPIVNSQNEPVGILHESQIKEFLYSPYGMSLLLNNETSKSKLKNLINSCGKVDINSDISTIIELFSNDTKSIGILVTQNSKYYGFLSARAIISIMNEENLILARDQNPLTKLPGNRMIDKYINKSIDKSNRYLLCYFDLDNFKAFNDVYGFRNGDRIIQLFADIMRKHLPQKFFKAHIGGDDFFAAIEYRKDDEDIFIQDVSRISDIFSDNAREFYSQEDKKRGYIESKDRDGNKKNFPLLTVSISILILNKHSTKRSPQNINDVLSVQKKVAKDEPKHISISNLL
ncbi:MAG: GGDEF domain-containing protein [Campylobacterota bacterium]|nr:GGDEF domain-containing protein [Campylobacterota bacterium]